MKTTAVAVTALLASVVFAQPYHGRHLHKKDLHKRTEVVVVTTTCTETATLIIDQDGTSLIEPTTSAQLYPSTTSDETISTTSTSTSSTSTSMSQPTTLSTSTTSTSTYVQPQPTTPTIQAQETTPTSTPTPTTEAPAYTQTTSEAAAPTYGSGGSSSGGGSYSGDLTYYDVGMGSCGIDSSGQTPTGATPSDPIIVALSHVQMGVWTGNPNLNPLCGKMIKITANGKTGYGKILDTCEGCLSNSIDVNVGGFTHFYDQSQGRAPCSWEYM